MRPLYPKSGRFPRRRPLLNPGGQRGFLCGGQCGRTACGLVACCTLEPRAAKPLDPCRDGLLVHAQDQGDLRNALAVYDCEDGEEIFDLAYVAEVLGRLQVALDLFTV